MLTKVQWGALTPQQQFDLYQSLAFDVEAREAEADAELERKQWNSAGIKIKGQRRIPVETLHVDDEDMTY